MEKGVKKPVKILKIQMYKHTYNLPVKLKVAGLRQRIS